MEKTIRIDGKDYKMKSSAYTQFAYKNETGRGLLSDIMDLQKLNLDKVNENVDIIDKLNATVLQMAYCMIKEADKSQVSNFEEFLRSIENLYDNTEWITETIELATSPLSRGLLKESKTNE